MFALSYPQGRSYLLSDTYSLDPLCGTDQRWRPRVTMCPVREAFDILYLEEEESYENEGT